MANEAAVEQELIKLEKQYWQALKDKDAATCIRLTDFPCVLTGPSGISRIDKDTFAKMMKDAKYTLDDFDFKKDVKVRLITDDVAVVAYKAHEDLTVDGTKVGLDVAESSTWVRKKGGWVCAHHTEAILGDPFGRDRTGSAPTSSAGASPAHPSSSGAV